MKKISLFMLRLFLSAGLIGAVWAQTSIRPIPSDAKRADMQLVGNGLVTLNGKTFRLSPAAQIRNTNNLLVLSQSLEGTYKVRVQLDGGGAVYRVWILTPEEAAQK